MEAWQQWLLGRQEKHVHKKPRIDLTPTGLLMEGHSASLRFLFALCDGFQMSDGWATRLG
jgi:hypothetical protein